jgi:hypothetical protein
MPQLSWLLFRGNRSIAIAADKQRNRYANYTVPTLCPEYVVRRGVPKLFAEYVVRRRVVPGTRRRCAPNTSYAAEFLRGTLVCRVYLCCANSTAYRCAAYHVLGAQRRYCVLGVLPRTWYAGYAVH